MDIFKAYDIRGTYCKSLTEKEAYLIGYYHAKLLKLKTLKIGHDLRLSFEPLTKFLIKGLIDANCKPIYLGKTSTPNFYFSLFQGCKSGIMITASHSPKEQNGFKFIINLESFDSRNGLFKLKEIIQKDKDQKAKYFEKIKNEITKTPLKKFLTQNKIKEQSTLTSYVDYLTTFYKKTLTENEIKVLDENQIKIGLDFSNGMSSLALTKLLKQINIKHQLSNHIPDGNFPNHSPNPFEAKDFIQKHNWQNCNFIATFDGDGDRIILFDEDKNFVLPDYTIALFIEHFKGKNKNFVCDLRASKIITDYCKNNKQKIKLIRVGRSYYEDYMNKHSCAFGGELSGHLFFKKFHNLDNPDIALIYLLKIIAKHIIKSKNQDKFKFSELIQKYKKYYKIAETNIKVKDAKKVLKTLQTKYKNNISMQIDGLSFDFKDYWFNIRKSNTEELIRINFEGKEETRTKKEFEKLIKSLK